MATVKSDENILDDGSGNTTIVGSSSNVTAVKTKDSLCDWCADKYCFSIDGLCHICRKDKALGHTIEEKKELIKNYGDTIQRLPINVAAEMCKLLMTPKEINSLIKTVVTYKRMGLITPKILHNLLDGLLIGFKKYLRYTEAELIMKLFANRSDTWLYDHAVYSKVVDHWNIKNHSIGECYYNRESSPFTLEKLKLYIPIRGETYAGTF
ncbi:MAG: hypothetical protein Faunusvirus3_24 [Faunusvirus sp.]|jgi:hypothetical protein|uniref:Uncharacterized protein n=1 Tax=Faunusvirus sp. TaxID=2487766 RepID=A0A3G4ZXS3_9VIRU|nr:MAG: hypothetical protein Faunusvirus3_24 [Faunusvirus sp.]